MRLWRGYYLQVEIIGISVRRLKAYFYVYLLLFSIPNILENN